MKALTFFICLTLGAFLLAFCTKEENSKPKLNNSGGSAVGKMSPAQQVEYGKYLVEIALCHDCHSPKVMTAEGPVPDRSRLLSGHPSDEKLPEISDKNILKGYILFSSGFTAAVGDWGTSFAGNLTPDDTGLGTWDLSRFEKALRHGKFKGLDNGRMLLPPMPWPQFSHLTDDDLAAIWAYLQTIPPVKNIVPAPRPPLM